MAQIEPNQNILDELYHLYEKNGAVIKSFTQTHMFTLTHNYEDDLTIVSKYELITHVLDKPKNPSELECFNHQLRLIKAERDLHVLNREFGRCYVMSDDLFKQVINLLNRLYVGSMTKSALKR